MGEIKFTKMVASGNDFVVTALPRYGVTALKKLAQKICNRKFGAGADGLLVLDRSKIADVRMRIFNADGSEAEMCGNGARCLALFVSAQRLPVPACPAGRRQAGTTQSAQLKIETKAGIINSEVRGESVKIKLTDPKDTKLGIPIRVNGRRIKVNFVDTGVPHVVIFVQGLDKIEVLTLGRYIRYHKNFAPRGTNVNFVEALGKNSIKIRTYERGVENETLACGTGAVASAVIFALKSNAPNRINVHTKAKEVLLVYFFRHGLRFKDVWLEGKAKIVYKGVYYV